MSNAEQVAAGAGHSATSAQAWPAWHCPAHGVDLRDAGGELTCPEDHVFPRRNGIPRFVSSEHYAGGFGAQWNRYRLTQLDSHTGTTISRDRARRCIGEELWGALAGKQVLECGCGAGRFTEVLVGQGAHVTSVDLSEAVEANARNLADEPNRRVAQADIGQLPFAPRQFDVVFCLGVVQHTPDSERTIACLYDQVRPGGTVVFDHYTYRLAWFLSMSPLYRRVFRRLSPERGLAYTDRLVRLLQPLHSRGRRYRKLLNRVSPVLTYYTVHPELSEEQQREWSFLDTHDTLTAWHRRHRSQGQARRTLERLGAEGIWTDRGGIGIEVRASRPADAQA